MKNMRSVRYVTRRAVSTARRRPLAASLAAFAVALIGVAGVSSELSGTSSKAAALPSTFRMSDPNSVFDARSPGGRGYGWLVNTKQPRTGFDVGPPGERVLTSVRHRPDAPAVPGGGMPVPAYTPVDVIPEAVGPAGDPLVDAVVPTNQGGVFIPGSPVLGGGVSGPGGGGTGGGGSGGTPGGTETNVPTTPMTPAVPEPSTWAMLVLGFFAMGAMLRLRHSTLRHEAC